MNNLFFKSANRLLEKSSIDLGILDSRLKFIQTEQRHQRSDLKEVKVMLNRLLIDKHLQMQVDNYFDSDEPPAKEDLD